MRPVPSVAIRRLIPTFRRVMTEALAIALVYSLTAATLAAQTWDAGSGAPRLLQPPAARSMASWISPEPSEVFPAAANQSGTGPAEFSSTAAEFQAGQGALSTSRSSSLMPAGLGLSFEQIQCSPTPDQLFANYYDPFSTQFTYGTDGAQQYQYGWLSYNDAVFIPESPARGVPGQMQILEWNSWVRFSTRVGDRLIFSWTPEFNGEFWRPPAGLGLPLYVNEFKSDFKLASVNPGRWNWQVGFTPQLNADLKRSLDANAYLFDGRAVALFRASPNWTLACGVEYWNRVHNYVIPYGGVIWTPNNRWEFRLLFPNSRVSYYLGNHHSFDLWAYASAEYLIEAYQIDTTMGIKERGQWKDYEVLFGFDAGKGKYSAFLQAGVIFDRHVRFNGPTPDFNLGNSVLVRTGFIF